jgi:ubiquitin-conjugating enzyme E2 O
VRVYEERMDLLRACIIGSAETPYHDGLFFFDIFFPADYPHEPPVYIYIYIFFLLSLCFWNEQEQ